MILTFNLLKRLRLSALLIVIPYFGVAQNLLNKPVTISVKGQPVFQVLKMIEEQGKFYFSYNSNLVPGDSLVTVQATGKTVANVLDQLFKMKYQFKEKGDYVIILPAEKERTVHIDGYVEDLETRAPVDYASIYSRKLLISTLSEDNGHFRLRIKDRAFPINITISKVGYSDTTIVIATQENTHIRVSLAQKAVDLDPLIVRYSEGEASWLGRLFLSAKLRAQSRNISKFFVSLPYQASLTPGLGTHGRMSSQVVNKVSLNLLGGYTAGVSGVEVAGGFNISKQDVRYAQIAGVFNLVSGHVKGVQVAGFLNQILDSLHGVQVSGFSGSVKKQVSGVQVSGFINQAKSALAGGQISGAIGLITENGKGIQVSGAYNQVSGEFDGIQVAGAANVVKGKSRGIQVSSALNFAGQGFHGLQVGSANYAKHLKGVQLGIVNVADSSAGVSFGLFNFIKKSTSNISIYASEIVPFNIALKMGTHKFYSILNAGASTAADKKAYVFGAGIGREFFPFKKAGFFTELSSQNIFQGSWENVPYLFSFQTAATYKLNKRFLLFAGPSFSVYQNEVKEKKPGYKTFPPKGYPGFDFSDKLMSWFGWQAGISWRYGRL
ncbi:STN and carboxypeptidase regulatory-like domain-containing protein [Dyadobacter sp. CY323]|uniref:STN and carboxypeptidase regulatory-like domain-containing protein n=1 Tax=Dyadobacter sp. CY323 TaxID=2907302 RepID=UPI001F25CA84|nr:STN and carboxypeptidase regulatory-like domain-containing protein [Dyadobacter sp. CY323]MCE6991751.1 carboxypeptidase-like regulatory domain-containing protein [Dyadobacter sp. CY323]